MDRKSFIGTVAATAFLATTAFTPLGNSAAENGHMKLSIPPKPIPTKFHGTSEEISVIHREMEASYGGSILSIVPDYHNIKEQAEIFGDDPDGLIREQIDIQLEDIGFELAARNSNVNRYTFADTYPDVLLKKLRMEKEEDFGARSYTEDVIFKKADDETEVIYIHPQSYGDKDDHKDFLSGTLYWQEGSFDVVRGAGDVATKMRGTAHHEIGHAYYFTKINKETGENPEYIKGTYSVFKHESIADVNRVLQMVKEGMNKEDYIDFLSLKRSYADIYHKGEDAHNSTVSIQALKEVPLEKIQGMTSDELAKYAIQFTLEGDQELGIKSPFPSEESFNQTKEMLSIGSHKNSLYYRLTTANKKHFELESTFVMPTPLQTKEIIEKFSKTFSEEEKSFLRENIIAHHDVVVTAMDYQYGLTDDPSAQALYEDMQRPRLVEPKAAVINDVIPEGIEMGKLPSEQSSYEQFYAEVQDHVWPRNAKGELANDIPAEFRKQQLDLYQSYLDNGKLTLPKEVTADAAQMVLNEHRFQLKRLDSYQETYGYLDEEMAQLDLEQINGATNELISKHRFVKSYMDYVGNGQDADEKMYRHAQFSRMFESSNPPPLPLDTSEQELADFFAVQAYKLTAKEKGDDPLSFTGNTKVR